MNRKGLQAVVDVSAPRDDRPGRAGAEHRDLQFCDGLKLFSHQRGEREPSHVTQRREVIPGFGSFEQLLGVHQGALIPQHRKLSVELLPNLVLLRRIPVRRQLPAVVENEAHGCDYTEGTTMAKRIPPFRLCQRTRAIFPPSASASVCSVL